MDREIKYYFAPLEGITGSVFRRTYDRFFGGIDAYYTPFVTTRDGGIMKKKELKEILPENNPGLHIIPQIMTRKADEFIQAAKHMEQLGYTEVNLNLGCPSGTVVPKGKGAGFLREPEQLDRFLEEIFDGCPIKISIKSRIGFCSADEFPKLMDIYKKYPAAMLILHLRTREEWYDGEIHKDAFRYAWSTVEDGQFSSCIHNLSATEHASIYENNNESSKHTTSEGSIIPLCYNGDIRSQSDIDEIKKEFPGIEHIMIGRGFLSHPGFAGNDHKKASYKDKKVLLEFSHALQEEYESVLYGETPVLFKMKELWSHMKDSFPEDDKLFKRIKKAKTLAEFNAVCPF